MSKEQDKKPVVVKLDVLLGLDDGAFQRGVENTRKKLDEYGEYFRNVGVDTMPGTEKTDKEPKS